MTKGGNIGKQASEVRLKSLKALHLKIRLKKPIQHASYRRTENDTLVVRCELSDGSVGWGEGLPRPYVTGETIESALEQITTSDLTLLKSTTFQDPLQVLDLIRQWQPAAVRTDGCDPDKSGFGNSVRCAIELACLDAACRSVGVGMGEIVEQLAGRFHLDERRTAVRYSGVITSSTKWLSQFRSALKMRLFGFSDVKLKVGHPEIDDVRLAGLVRRVIGSRVELRVDANEAWSPTEAKQRIEELIPFGIQSIEQPIADSLRHEIATLKESVSIPLMLDESVCCVADAEAAVKSRQCDAFNLRLSKCGGFQNCLEMMSLAISNGLFIQLGCLVGETGILSAAGRHLACHAGPFRWLEGSYDRFIIHDRLTQQDLTFGYGGKAKAIEGLGLGVDIDEAAVRERTQRVVDCFA